MLKKWWFWVGIIVIFAIIGAAISNNSQSSEKLNNNSQNSEVKSEDNLSRGNEDNTRKVLVTTVKIGEPLQVGEVKWKVLNAEKQGSIKSEFSERKANGVFVIIYLEAELLGKESGNISDVQFKIVDDKGRTYEPDSEATLELSMVNKDPILFEEVHPNVPKKGYICFDIAKDSKNLKLYIYDLRIGSDDYGVVQLGF